MKDTLRNRVILEKLKSLQDDLINEQFDIKDLIIELGGGKREYNSELRQEFKQVTDDLLVITSLIDTREGF
tara:strand:- start:437 stop:649 length:213 start_codon:yes stop_codon:yes gene_type:complete